MFSRIVEGSKWQMMEFPNGITTSNGNWYNITRDYIEKYVPGLLKKVPLERILKEADAWTISGDALALLLYFLLVYLSVSPFIAFLGVLLFFLFWYTNTSAFVLPAFSKIIQAITNDGFLYSVSAILLIGISLNEQLSDFGIELMIELHAVWYGIALIFLFKVGLLRLLLKFISSKSSSKKASLHDRVLNMLLIRYGMKYGTLTRSVDQMQDELIKVANYHKTRKKK